MLFTFICLCKVNDLNNQYNHASTIQERDTLETAVKLAQAQKQEHINRALASREGYYDRRSKAVMDFNVNRGYLSMIIDGAGAQASNYCPRYATTEKGEPARHNMFKIKSTYIKVRYM